MARLSTHIVCALLLLVVTACPRSQIEVSVQLPVLAPLLNGLELRGEVIILEEGREVGSASLLVIDDRASGSLGGLPSNRDLFVVVRWLVGDVVLAATREPKRVRISSGKNTELTLSLDDYLYPDDDGDGVENLYELLFARDNPSDGGGAVGDATIQPRGFFSGIAGVISLPGDIVTGVDVRALGSFAMVTTAALVNAGPTFGDHQIDIISLPSRERLSLPIVCPSGWIVDTVANNRAATSPRGAASCGGQIHFFLPDEEQLELLSTTTLLGGQGDALAFSKSGRRLYALDLFAGRIWVLHAGAETPVRYGIEEAIEQATLGNGAQVSDLVDDGKRLLITDPGRNGLIVVDHVDDTAFSVLATPLQGQLAEPTALVLHPRGHRAYVANAETGTVAVIDISAEDPAAWSLLTEIPVAVEVSSLAIEPTYGAWLYAVAPSRIVRIDTLTYRVGWQQEFDSEYGLLTEIALSEGGGLGVLGGGEAAALYLLGNPPLPHTEREPNQSFAEARTSSALLGPRDHVAVGWGNMAEQGEVEIDFTLHNCMAALPFLEDIEDLWRFEAQTTGGGSAIALQPSSATSRLSLALLDGNEQLLADALQRLAPGVLTIGTGVFLLAPPATDLPAEVFVGVDTTDANRTFNASPYEVIVRDVPWPLPVFADSEPNDDAASAHPITLSAMTIQGSADPADNGAIIAWGSEDVEDCYLVPTGGGRVAVRLDFDATVDLDLTVHELDGTRFVGQFAMCGPGQSEFFMFEPHFRDGNALVCVTVEDAAVTGPAAYRLTFVDFDL